MWSRYIPIISSRMDGGPKIARHAGQRYQRCSSLSLN
jgi:hypothetical protein